jgi:hypothetical protein
VQAVYRYYAWLVWIAVIVQIGLSGWGAFTVSEDTSEGSVDESAFDDAFSPHGALGFFLTVGALLFILIALGARAGKRRVLFVVGLFGLFVLQMLLAGFGSEVPLIGVLHPINAVVIAGYSWWIASTAWKGESTLDRVAGGP